MPSPISRFLTICRHKISIVYDGRYGWVVSGLGRNGDLPSSGILRVDPISDTVTFVSVDGFPASDSVEFLLCFICICGSVGKNLHFWWDQLHTRRRIDVSRRHLVH